MSHHFVVHADTSFEVSACLASSADCIISQLHSLAAVAVI